VKRWSIENEPNDREIEEIASVLLSGGVVLLPTDTVYGLHALPDFGSRIAAIKGRDENKPFVTIAASIEQIESIGIEVPDQLREVWPAPLTAILYKNKSTLAIRVPDLAWLRSLLEQTGPLVSTSANRSGEDPITAPNDLARDLQTALDGIVDAGRREGKASTIVDFTGDEPRVLREGDPRFSQILWKSLRKSL
jgi:tRNA threonylcarbamoyl adenosine modification protein (Sua5/YciO/YrdC/YwlC family)